MNLNQKQATELQVLRDAARGEADRVLELGAQDLLREALTLSCMAQDAGPEHAQALQARAGVLLQLAMLREARDTRTVLRKLNDTLATTSAARGRADGVFG